MIRDTSSPFQQIKYKVVKKEGEESPTVEESSGSTQVSVSSTTVTTTRRKLAVLGAGPSATVQTELVGLEEVDEVKKLVKSYLEKIEKLEDENASLRDTMGAAMAAHEGGGGGGRIVSQSHSHALQCPNCGSSAEAHGHGSVQTLTQTGIRSEEVVDTVTKAGQTVKIFRSSTQTTSEGSETSHTAQHRDNTDDGTVTSAELGLEILLQKVHSLEDENRLLKDRLEAQGEAKPDPDSEEGEDSFVTIAMGQEALGEVDIHTLQNYSKDELLTKVTQLITENKTLKVKVEEVHILSPSKANFADNIGGQGLEFQKIEGDKRALEQLEPEARLALFQERNAPLKVQVERPHTLQGQSDDARQSFIENNLVQGNSFTHAQYEQQVVDLQVQLDRLKEENSTLALQVQHAADTESEARKIQEEVAYLRSEIERLTTEKDNYAEQVERSREVIALGGDGALRELTEGISSLQAQLKEKTDELEDTEEVLASIRAELDAARQQKYKFEDQKTRLEGEASKSSAMRQELETLKAQLEVSKKSEVMLVETLEQVESLQTENARLESEREALNLKVDETARGFMKVQLLEQEVEKLNVDLKKQEETEKELQEVKESLDVARREKASLEEDQGAYNRHKEEVREAKEKIQVLQETLAVLAKQVKDADMMERDLETALTEARENLTAVTSEKAALLQTADCRTKELEVAQEKIQTLQGQVQDAETRTKDLEAAQEKIQTLEGQVQDAESRTKELEAAKEKIQTLQEKVQDAESRTNELEVAQEKIQTLQGQVQDAETRTKDLEAAQEKIQTLEGQVQDAESRTKELEAAQEKIQALQGQVQDAETRTKELEAAQEKIQKLQGQVQNTETRTKELDAAQKKIQRLQGQVQDLDAKSTALTTTKQQLESTKKELDALQLKNAALETQVVEISDLKKEITVARAVIQQLREGDEQAESKHKEESAKLENDLKISRENMDTLKTEKDALAAKCTASVQELEEARGHIKTLEAEKQTLLTAEQKHKAKDLQEAHDRLEVLSEENNRLLKEQDNLQKQSEDLSVARKQIQSLQEKFTLQAELFDKIQGDLTRKVELVEDLQIENQKLQNQNKNLGEEKEKKHNERVVTLETEIVELTSRLEKAEVAKRDLQATEKELANIRAEKEEFIKEREVYQVQLAKKEDEVANTALLETEVSTLKEKMQGLKRSEQELTELQTKFAAITQECEGRDRALEALRKEKEVFCNQLNEMEGLKKEIAIARNVIKELRESQEKTSEQEQEQKSKELTNVLEKTRKEVNILQEEKEEMSKCFVATQKQLEDARSQIEQLEGEKQSLNSTSEDATQLKAQLEEAKTSLTTELQNFFTVQSELQGALERIETLEEEKKLLEEEAKEATILERELSVAREESHQLRVEKSSATEKVEAKDIQTDSGVARKRAAKLKREREVYAEQKMQSEELRKDLEAAKQEIQRLKEEQVNDDENNQTSVTSTSVSTSTVITTEEGIETELSKAMERIQALEEERIHLKEEIRMAHQQQTDFSGAIGDVQKQESNKSVATGKSDTRDMQTDTKLPMDGEVAHGQEKQVKQTEKEQQVQKEDLKHPKEDDSSKRINFETSASPGIAPTILITTEVNDIQTEVQELKERIQLLEKEKMQLEAEVSTQKMGISTGGEKTQQEGPNSSSSERVEAKEIQTDPGVARKRAAKLRGEKETPMGQKTQSEETRKERHSSREDDDDDDDVDNGNIERFVSTRSVSSTEEQRHGSDSRVSERVDAKEVQTDPGVAKRRAAKLKREKGAEGQRIRSKRESKASQKERCSSKEEEEEEDKDESDDGNIERFVSTKTLSSSEEPQQRGLDSSAPEKVEAKEIQTDPGVARKRAAKLRREKEGPGQKARSEETGKEINLAKKERLSSTEEEEDDHDVASDEAITIERSVSPSEKPSNAKDIQTEPGVARRRAGKLKKDKETTKSLKAELQAARQEIGRLQYELQVKMVAELHEANELRVQHDEMRKKTEKKGATLTDKREMTRKEAAQSEEDEGSMATRTQTLGTKDDWVEESDRPLQTETADETRAQRSPGQADKMVSKQEADTSGLARNVGRYELQVVDESYFSTLSDAEKVTVLMEQLHCASVAMKQLEEEKEQLSMEATNVVALQQQLYMVQTEVDHLRRDKESIIESIGIEVGIEADHGSIREEEEDFNDELDKVKSQLLQYENIDRQLAEARDTVDTLLSVKTSLEERATLLENQAEDNEDVLRELVKQNAEMRDELMSVEFLKREVRELLFGDRSPSVSSLSPMLSPSSRKLLEAGGSSTRFDFGTGQGGRVGRGSDTESFASTDNYATAEDSARSTSDSDRDLATEIIGRTPTQSSGTDGPKTNEILASVVKKEKGAESDDSQDSIEVLRVSLGGSNDRKATTGSSSETTISTVVQTVHYGQKSDKTDGEITPTVGGQVASRKRLTYPAGSKGGEGGQEGSHASVRQGPDGIREMQTSSDHHDAENAEDIQVNDARKEQTIASGDQHSDRMEGVQATSGHQGTGTTQDTTPSHDKVTEKSSTSSTTVMQGKDGNINKEIQDDSNGDHGEKDMPVSGTSDGTSASGDTVMIMDTKGVKKGLSEKSGVSWFQKNVGSVFGPKPSTKTDDSQGEKDDAKDTGSFEHGEKAKTVSSAITSTDNNDRSPLSSQADNTADKDTTSSEPSQEVSKTDVDTVIKQQLGVAAVTENTKHVIKNTQSIKLLIENLQRIQMRIWQSLSKCDNPDNDNSDADSAIMEMTEEMKENLEEMTTVLAALHLSVSQESDNDEEHHGETEGQDFSIAQKEDLIAKLQQLSASSKEIKGIQEEMANLCSSNSGDPSKISKFRSIVERLQIKLGTAVNAVTTMQQVEVAILKDNEQADEEEQPQDHKSPHEEETSTRGFFDGIRDWWRGSSDKRSSSTEEPVSQKDEEEKVDASNKDDQDERDTTVEAAVAVTGPMQNVQVKEPSLDDILAPEDKTEKHSTDVPTDTGGTGTTGTPVVSSSRQSELSKVELETTSEQQTGGLSDLKDLEKAHEKSKPRPFFGGLVSWWQGETPNVSASEDDEKVSDSQNQATSQLTGVTQTSSEAEETFPDPTTVTPAGRLQNVQTIKALIEELYKIRTDMTENEKMREKLEEVTTVLAVLQTSLDVEEDEQKEFTSDSSAKTGQRKDVCGKLQEVSVCVEDLKKIQSDIESLYKQMGTDDSSSDETVKIEADISRHMESMGLKVDAALESVTMIEQQLADSKDDKTERKQEGSSGSTPEGARPWSFIGALSTWWHRGPVKDSPVPTSSVPEEAGGRVDVSQTDRDDVVEDATVPDLSDEAKETIANMQIMWIYMEDMQNIYRDILEVKHGGASGEADRDTSKTVQEKTVEMDRKLDDIASLVSSTTEISNTEQEHFLALMAKFRKMNKNLADLKKKQEADAERGRDTAYVDAKIQRKIERMGNRLSRMAKMVRKMEAQAISQLAAETDAGFFSRFFARERTPGTQEIPDEPDDLPETTSEEVTDVDDTGEEDTIDNSAPAEPVVSPEATAFTANMQIIRSHIREMETICKDTVDDYSSQESEGRTADKVEEGMSTIKEKVDRTLSLLAEIETGITTEPAEENQQDSNKEEQEKIITMTSTVLKEIHELCCETIDFVRVVDGQDRDVAATQEMVQQNMRKIQTKLGTLPEILAKSETIATEEQASSINSLDIGDVSQLEITLPAKDNQVSSTEDLAVNIQKAMTHIIELDELQNTIGELYAERFRDDIDDVQSEEVDQILQREMKNIGSQIWVVWSLIPDQPNVAQSTEETEANEESTGPLGLTDAGWKKLSQVSGTLLELKARQETLLKVYQKRVREGERGEEGALSCITLDARMEKEMAGIEANTGSAIQQLSEVLEELNVEQHDDTTDASVMPEETMILIANMQILWVYITEIKETQTHLQDAYSDRFGDGITGEQCKEVDKTIQEQKESMDAKVEKALTVVQEIQESLDVKHDNSVDKAQQVTAKSKLQKVASLIQEVRNKNLQVSEMHQKQVNEEGDGKDEDSKAFIDVKMQQELQNVFTKLSQTERLVTAAEGLALGHKLPDETDTTEDDTLDSGLNKVSEEKTQSTGPLRCLFRWLSSGYNPDHVVFPEKDELENLATSHPEVQAEDVQPIAETTTEGLTLQDKTDSRTDETLDTATDITTTQAKKAEPQGWFRGWWSSQATTTPSTQAPVEAPREVKEEDNVNSNADDEDRASENVPQSTGAFRRLLRWYSNGYNPDQVIFPEKEELENLATSHPEVETTDEESIADSLKTSTKAAMSVVLGLKEICAKYQGQAIATTEEEGPDQNEEVALDDENMQHDIAVIGQKVTDLTEYINKLRVVTQYDMTSKDEEDTQLKDDEQAGKKNTDIDEESQKFIVTFDKLLVQMQELKSCETELLSITSAEKSDGEEQQEPTTRILQVMKELNTRICNVSEALTEIEPKALAHCESIKTAKQSIVDETVATLTPQAESGGVLSRLLGWAPDFWGRRGEEEEGDDPAMPKETTILIANMQSLWVYITEMKEIQTRLQDAYSDRFGDGITEEQCKEADKAIQVHKKGIDAKVESVLSVVQEIQESFDGDQDGCIDAAQQVQANTTLQKVASLIQEVKDTNIQISEMYQKQVGDEEEDGEEGRTTALTDARMQQELQNVSLKLSQAEQLVTVAERLTLGHKLADETESDETPDGATDISTSEPKKEDVKLGWFGRWWSSQVTEPSSQVSVQGPSEVKDEPNIDRKADNEEQVSEKESQSTGPFRRLFRWYSSGYNSDHVTFPDEDELVNLAPCSPEEGANDMQTTTDTIRNGAKAAKSVVLDLKKMCAGFQGQANTTTEDGGPDQTDKVASDDESMQQNIAVIGHKITHLTEHVNEMKKRVVAQYEIMSKHGENGKLKDSEQMDKNNTDFEEERQDIVVDFDKLLVQIQEVKSCETKLLSLTSAETSTTEEHQEQATKFSQLVKELDVALSTVGKMLTDIEPKALEQCVSAKIAKPGGVDEMEATAPQEEGRGFLSRLFGWAQRNTEDPPKQLVDISEETAGIDDKERDPVADVQRALVCCQDINEARGKVLENYREQFREGTSEVRTQETGQIIHRELGTIESKTTELAELIYKTTTVDKGTMGEQDSTEQGSQEQGSPIAGSTSDQDKLLLYIEVLTCCEDMKETQVTITELYDRRLRESTVVGDTSEACVYLDTRINKELGSIESNITKITEKLASLLQEFSGRKDAKTEVEKSQKHEETSRFLDRFIWWRQTVSEDEDKKPADTYIPNETGTLVAHMQMIWAYLEEMKQTQTCFEDAYSDRLGDGITEEQIQGVEKVISTQMEHMEKTNEKVVVLLEEIQQTMQDGDAEDVDMEQQPEVKLRLQEIASIMMECKELRCHVDELYHLRLSSDGEANQEGAVNTSAISVDVQIHQEMHNMRKKLEKAGQLLLMAEALTQGCKVQVPKDTNTGESEEPAEDAETPVDSSWWWSSDATDAKESRTQSTESPPLLQEQDERQRANLSKGTAKTGMLRRVFRWWSRGYDPDHVTFPDREELTEIESTFSGKDDSQGMTQKVLDTTDAQSTRQDPGSSEDTTADKDSIVDLKSDQHEVAPEPNERRGFLGRLFQWWRTEQELAPPDESERADISLTQEVESNIEVIKIYLFELRNICGCLQERFTMEAPSVEGGAGVDAEDKDKIDEATQQLIANRLEEIAALVNDIGTVIPSDELSSAATDQDDGKSITVQEDLEKIRVNLQDTNAIFTEIQRMQEQSVTSTSGHVAKELKNMEAKLTMVADAVINIQHEVLKFCEEPSSAIQEEESVAPPAGKREGAQSAGVLTRMFKHWWETNYIPVGDQLQPSDESEEEETDGAEEDTRERIKAAASDQMRTFLTNLEITWVHILELKRIQIDMEDSHKLQGQGTEDISQSCSNVQQELVKMGEKLVTVHQLITDLQNSVPEEIMAVETKEADEESQSLHTKVSEQLKRISSIVDTLQTDQFNVTNKYSASSYAEDDSSVKQFDTMFEEEMEGIRMKLEEVTELFTDVESIVLKEMKKKHGKKEAESNKSRKVTATTEKEPTQAQREGIFSRLFRWRKGSQRRETEPESNEQSSTKSTGEEKTIKEAESKVTLKKQSLVQRFSDWLTGRSTCTSDKRGVSQETTVEMPAAETSSTAQPSEGVRTQVTREDEDRQAGVFSTIVEWWSHSIRTNSVKEKEEAPTMSPGLQNFIASVQLADVYCNQAQTSLAEMVDIYHQVPTEGGELGDKKREEDIENKLHVIENNWKMLLSTTANLESALANDGEGREDGLKVTEEWMTDDVTREQALTVSHDLKEMIQATLQTLPWIKAKSVGEELVEGEQGETTNITIQAMQEMYSTLDNVRIKLQEVEHCILSGRVLHGEQLLQRSEVKALQDVAAEETDGQGKDTKTSVFGQVQRWWTGFYQPNYDQYTDSMEEPGSNSPPVQLLTRREDLNAATTESLTVEDFEPTNDSAGILLHEAEDESIMTKGLRLELDKQLDKLNERSEEQGIREGILGLLVVASIWFVGGVLYVNTNHVL